MRDSIIKFGLLFMATIFTSTSVADLFDSSSYQRQQNASDSAFESFDKEFAEPKKPAPAPVTPPPTHEHEAHNTAPANKMSSAEVEQQAKQIFAAPDTVEVNGLKFDLASCRLQHNNVMCEINITSFEVDRALTIVSYYSSFYDNQGNQFKLSSSRLGNKEANASQNLSSKLISGIKTKLSVTFENVSSKTTAVALLELDARANNRKVKVQFRNIPLI